MAKGQTDYWYPDYLLPFWIGVFEIFSYPIIMKTAAWDVIGAWIGLKTIAQWDQWKLSRSSFNRFLIGNLLVLLSSFLLAAKTSLVQIIK